MSPRFLKTGYGGAVMEEMRRSGSRMKCDAAGMRHAEPVETVSVRVARALVPGGQAWLHPGSGPCLSVFLSGILHVHRSIF